MKLRYQAEEAAAAADWPRYDDVKRRQTAADAELNDDSQTVVTSDQVVAATVGELANLAADGRPWFLFAHFFDAHCDYVPPPPYDTRFDPDYTGTFSGKGCMGGPAVGYWRHRTFRPRSSGPSVRAAPRPRREADCACGVSGGILPVAGSTTSDERRSTR